MNLRRWISAVLLCGALLGGGQAMAQCAICARTAAQQGEKPAKGLNAGILYLMFTPFTIVGIIGYKFYKSMQDQDETPEA